LKVLSVGALHDARQKIRFENEARAAAQLKHANIVPVYSVGSDRDTQFYAMQFIDGHSLAVEVVRRRQAQAEAESKGGRLATVAKTADQTVMINDNLLSPAQNYDPISCVNVANRMGDVARIGIQVAGGLEHAHELGVIHRDIKPANLLREKTGDVWIADFGLARCQENSELTQTGERLGTLPYMSPEQVLGENVHHRTDIYSLGVTLYELATLQRAFPEQDAVRLLQQLASQEPIAPRKLDSNVPVDLETIILKAMAKAESERYASAGDLADDLQRFLDHKPILARRPSLWKRLGKWTRRHRSLAASVAAMGVCSLFIIAIITSIAAARMNVLRKNAVDARDVARLSQFHATFESAESHRLAGRRIVALKSIREASQLAASLPAADGRRGRLRNLAIGCLSVPLGTKKLNAKEFDDGGWLAAPDAKLTRYARALEREGATSKGQGQDIGIYRVSDHQLLARVCGHFTDWCLSPDGKYLIATCGPQPYRVSIWDLSDLAEPRVVVKGLETITNSSHMFDLNKEGTRVAIIQPNRSVAVHQVSTGERLYEVRLPFQPSQVRFHPEGLSLARDNRVELWQLESGQELQSYPYTASIRNHDWSQDGRLLAAATQDQEIVVWERESKDPLRTIKQRTSGVRLQFSPNGRSLASSSFRGTSFWNPNSGKLQGRVDARFGGFHETGTSMLLNNTHNVSQWELNLGDALMTLARSQKMMETHKNRSEGIDCMLDGRIAAAADLNGLHLRDTLTGALLASMPLGRVTWHQVSTDGKYLLTKNEDGLMRWPVRILSNSSVAVGPPKVIASGHVESAHVAKHDPRLVVSVKDRNTAVLLDIEQPGKEIARLQGHARMMFVDISADGRWVATGPWHGKGIQIWDRESEKPVRELWPECARASVFFSPQGSWLIAANSREFRFYRLADEVVDWHEDFRIPRGETGDSTPQITFSPVDPNIVVLDHDDQLVRVLRLRLDGPPEEIAVLEALHPSIVSGFRFTPDGTKLLVNSVDGIRLWDLALIEGELRDLGLSWETPQFQREVAQKSMPSDNPTLSVQVDLGILQDRYNAPVKIAHPYVAHWALKRGSSASPKTDVELAGALWKIVGTEGRIGLEEEAKADCRQIVALCDRALAGDPNLSQAYHYRAHAHHWLGHWRDAVRDFGDASRLAPNSSHLHQTRAGILFRLGRYAEAVENWSQVIRITPEDSASAHEKRGECYLALDRFEPALADFGAAIDQTRASRPDRLDWLFSRRAAVQVKKGDDAAAIQDYTEAIRLSGKTPTWQSKWLHQRAMIYGRTKRIPLAMADHTQALCLNPEDAKARRELKALTAKLIENSWKSFGNLGIP